MKWCIFLVLMLATDFAACELMTNRTFPRSRYSLRNRKQTQLSTERPETATSDLPETTPEPEETTSRLREATPVPQETTLGLRKTTLGPLEVVVESQAIRVTEPNTKKVGRQVSQQIKASDILQCGDRYHDDAPWIVVIEHRDPTGRDTRKTLSKGVLISSRHVLTTVSSIHNTHPYWIATRVRLGDFPTWMNENIVRDRSQIQTIDIDKVYQHSNKDIAILQLKETVIFSESIQPICLPTSTKYKHPEMYLHICKRVRDHGHKHHAKMSTVKALSLQDCKTMFNRKGAIITDGEFCAWDEFGDTCTGDIGGPLIANFYGKYMLVGLNSFVLTEKEFDATDYPGVYVNVGYFIKWIDDIISIREY